MSEIRKKLKEVLNETVSRQIISDLSNGKEVSVSVESIGNDEFLLKNDGEGVLTYEASKSCNSIPNAISALRDLSIEIGESHLSKNHISKFTKF